MRETSITLLELIQKHENPPDFLCMNAMHTSVSSHFVVPISWDVTMDEPGPWKGLSWEVLKAPQRSSHVALRGKDFPSMPILELAKESDLERVFLAGNLSELYQTWGQVY